MKITKKIIDQIATKQQENLWSIQLESNLNFYFYVTDHGWNFYTTNPDAAYPIDTVSELIQRIFLFGKHHGKTEKIIEMQTALGLR